MSEPNAGRKWTNNYASTITAKSNPGALHGFSRLCQQTGDCQQELISSLGREPKKFRAAGECPFSCAFVFASIAELGSKKARA
jgi:hypothetical protein